MRPYGINVLSLWPRSIGPNGPMRSVQLALAAGYDGIQALPLKWWSYHDMDKWKGYVISYEHAWLYGTFWQFVLKKLGCKDPNAPRLMDLVLFGAFEVPSIPNAILCEHHPVDPSTRTVFETNPNVWQSQSKYREYALKGGGICWDTRHVREADTQKKGSIANWDKFLEKLPRGSIRLIHLNFMDGELEGLLVGQKSELTLMLTRLEKKVYRDVPIIVEVPPPPILSKQKLVERFAKIKREAQRYIN